MVSHFYNSFFALPDVKVHPKWWLNKIWKCHLPKEKIIPFSNPRLFTNIIIYSSVSIPPIYANYCWCQVPPSCNPHSLFPMVDNFPRNIYAEQGNLPLDNKKLFITSHCESDWRLGPWLSTLPYPCPSSISQICQLHGGPVTVIPSLCVMSLLITSFSTLTTSSSSMHHSSYLYSGLNEVEKEVVKVWVNLELLFLPNIQRRYLV